ncbi:hypothetical protein DEAB109302_14965 [Dermacoccus abyssi]
MQAFAAYRATGKAGAPVWLFVIVAIFVFGVFAFQKFKK